MVSELDFAANDAEDTSGEQSTGSGSVLSEAVGAIQSGARAAREAITAVPAAELIGAAVAGGVAAVAARAALEAMRQTREAPPDSRAPGRSSGENGETPAQRQERRAPTGRDRQEGRSPAERGAEGENGRPQELSEAMRLKLKMAAQEMLKEAKEKKLANPEKFTNFLSEASAQAIAVGIQPDGSISAGAMAALKKHFEMAGSLGGAQNQERFMRGLTIALQERNLYMLHQANPPAGGTCEHRIVITNANGTMVGDGSFRVRQR